jgi:hypothetical protein
MEEAKNKRKAARKKPTMLMGRCFARYERTQKKSKTETTQNPTGIFL